MNVKLFMVERKVHFSNFIKEASDYYHYILEKKRKFRKHQQKSSWHHCEFIIKEMYKCLDILKYLP
jgi:hypothetical protein